MGDNRPLCPKCKGRGWMMGRKCKACHGYGRVLQVVESGPIHIEAKLSSLVK